MATASRAVRAFARSPLALAAGLLLSTCGPGSPPAPVVAFPLAWPHAAGSRPAAGRQGAVAADARLASEVGAEILRQGGNAVDAEAAYSPGGNLGSVNGILRSDNIWAAFSDPRAGGRPIAY